MAWRLSRRRRLAVFASILGLLCVSLPLRAVVAQSTLTQTPPRWVDDQQQVWTVPKTLPKRWVVLGPHLVDMIVELQLPHVIVGVQDDHPSIGRWQRSLTGFPVVAQASQLNEERIRRAKPDLIIYWPSGLAGNQQARLQKLGIPLLAIDPQTLDDIPKRLRWLGALGARNELAAKQATKLQHDLERVRQQYAEGRRLRGLYQVWLQPLYSLAPQHLVSQAMVLCGVDSIVPKTNIPAPILQLEFVLSAQPEVILLSQGQLRASQRFWQRFPDLPAVKRQGLVVVNDHALTRPGLSLLRAIPTLCHQLLPFRTLPNGASMSS